MTHWNIDLTYHYDKIDILIYSAELECLQDYFDMMQTIYLYICPTEEKLASLNDLYHIIRTTHLSSLGRISHEFRIKDYIFYDNGAPIETHIYSLPHPNATISLTAYKKEE